MLPQYTSTRVTRANGGREAKSGVIISVAAVTHAGMQTPIFFFDCILRGNLVP